MFWSLLASSLVFCALTYTYFRLACIQWRVSPVTHEVRVRTACLQGLEGRKLGQIGTCHFLEKTANRPKTREGTTPSSQQCCTMDALRVDSFLLSCPYALFSHTNLSFVLEMTLYGRELLKSLVPLPEGYTELARNILRFPDDMQNKNV